jgi:predicted peptidase
MRQAKHTTFFVVCFLSPTNKKMRSCLVTVVFISLIISSCDKPEEIVPIISRTDTAAITSTAKIKGDTASASKDTVVVNKDTVKAKPDTTVIAADTLKADNKDVSSNDAAIYQREKFRDMPYRIMLPKNYNKNKSYPILIFLHGIGERGSDNEKQLIWGSSLFQADSIRENYPAFIVFPQCKSSEYWFDNWATQTLKGLLDDLQTQYNINGKKIYIGGLSMGAYGTYAIVAEYPELFAAAVAISGDGDERKANSMTKTKWRIFAGKKDGVVSWTKSEKMAAALRRSHASVLFTVYNDADHTGSWVNAFAEPDFCSWLFSISK